MRIDIVPLFPELCDGFLSASILGRARAKNLFEAHCHQIRDYTKNKQKQTDDYPYGGGCGMVLYAQPIADCLRTVQAQCAAQGRAKPHVVFLTAAGRPYNEEKARGRAGYDAVTLIAVSGLGLLVVDAHRRLWGAVFVIGLAAEQLIAGLRILKIDFWYATYVVYGESSALANAANLGIISVGIGVAVFAVLWVGLLVTIKKESPLNVLTRSWASFIFFCD